MYVFVNNLVLLYVLNLYQAKKQPPYGGWFFRSILNVMIKIFYSHFPDDDNVSVPLESVQ